MRPQTLTKFYTKFSAFDPPFGGVIITRKQKFLSSFQLWHLTSFPTTTLPTEYETNRLTPHFQVLHRFLSQSLLIPQVNGLYVGNCLSTPKIPETCHRRASTWHGQALAPTAHKVALTGMHVFK